VARITGRRASERRLSAVALRSAEALRLWAEVLGTARNRPAPFSSFDAFVHMSPIVSMRGTRRAIRYYHALLKELEGRIAEGRAAVPGESGRVVWDNIAIWPAHRELKRLFRDERVTLVADTYTSAWSATGLDADDPYAGLARAYCDILLNHGAAHRTAVLTRLVEEFGADGFILHSNRSCKRYSLGQFGVRRQVAEATGVPGLVIEADMADPRSVSFDNLKQRLQPFFEAVRK
jgi:benzoyl-CoA reductase/2-hydroxyglutaryl-CoA dehydratase subunit BcrC/BadD/HgdB